MSLNLSRSSRLPERKPVCFYYSRLFADFMLVLAFASSFACNPHKLSRIHSFLILDIAMCGPCGLPPTPLDPLTPPVGPSVTQTGVFFLIWTPPHTHTHTSFDGPNKFVSVHRWCERQKSWTGFMKTHRFMFYINIGGVSRLYWSRIYKWTKASMHPHAALRISLHMMRLWSIHVTCAATILISSRLLFFFSWKPTYKNGASL